VACVTLSSMGSHLQWPFWLVSKSWWDAGDPRSLMGMEYLDDRLSVGEQEALCGIYHCLIG
jgi:hypothetical protein